MRAFCERDTVYTAMPTSVAVIFHIVEDSALSPACCRLYLIVPLAVRERTTVPGSSRSIMNQYHYN